MMKRPFLYPIAPLPLLALLICAALAYSTIPPLEPLEWFAFSQEDELEDWSEKVLNGKVAYWIDYIGNNGFLHSRSIKACSAIYRKVTIDIDELPMVSWKWSVVQFPDKPAPEFDDYPARLYVCFPGISFSRSKFLEYVWDRNQEKESVLTGAAENIKIIVVRSGDCEEGLWCIEERNIHDDYVMAFGAEPPKRVRAIAIMSDADGTESSAEALFDDIKVGYYVFSQNK
ncbi:MAG: DUF3047 domain-containing protein [Candidatus Omnitrophica bacterium]|nr:DUF3047 domain-containing protein [Candidatus Omnitrophota bacterium]